MPGDGRTAVKADDGNVCIHAERADPASRVAKSKAGSSTAGPSATRASVTSLFASPHQLEIATHAKSRSLHHWKGERLQVEPWKSETQNLSRSPASVGMFPSSQPQCFLV